MKQTTRKTQPKRKVVKKGKGVASVGKKIVKGVVKAAPKVIRGVKRLIEGARKARKTYQEYKPLIEEGVDLAKKTKKTVQNINETRKNIKNPRNFKEVVEAGKKLGKSALKNVSKQDLIGSTKKLGEKAIPKVKEDLDKIFYLQQDTTNN